MFINFLSAQRAIDSLGVAEDFIIFENILKKGHPNLYEYISNDSLDYVFDLTKNQIKDTSDIDVYKTLLGITNHIKDSHLVLLPPKILKKDQYYFPLSLKIINHHLYTDTDDFDIPVGSQIIQINDQKSDHILEKLKKYIPADGHNLTRKYRMLEALFGEYYFYEFGLQKQFLITYRQLDGTEASIELPAESSVKVKLRNAKRYSYFAKFHGEQNNFKFYTHFIVNKSPFTLFKKELNTAVLVVNSFAGDTRVFKSHVEDIFKEIEQQKIQNLVIDIRNNKGGFRSNTISLYSHITNKPFKQITSEFVASLSIPEKKHAIRSFSNEKQVLKAKFNNHPVYDGWKFNFDDLETMMIPSQNKFTGKVYVLIGGATSSEASIFALNAKNNKNITLLGEETGGGYYFSNGELPVYYELPNSKIKVIMNMQKNNHYITDKNVPKGSGVMPDKHINMSVEHLTLSKDPLLDYIFRLIKGNN
ncbi:S41 family peptidase [Aquimarina algicola]|nr:S41 family peptidase [Aquimarina algicola]